MSIIFSKFKPVNLEMFINRYTALIETRLLKDVNISFRSNSYKQLKEVFGLLRRLNVSPYKFLDYTFKNTDGLAFPLRLSYFLKNYKELPGAFLSKTIYDWIKKDIEILKREMLNYDNHLEFYVKNNINPFVAVCDDSIKMCLWHSSVPKEWIYWDPDLYYYKKIYVAFLMIQNFKKIKHFIYEQLEAE